MLGPEVSETSEHDIDPECHLVAIEIEASAARKYRAPGMEVKGLIAKVAVAIFNSDANDVIKRVLNSTAGVPTSQNIGVMRNLPIRHPSDKSA